MMVYCVNIFKQPKSINRFIISTLSFIALSKCVFFLCVPFNGDSTMLDTTDEYLTLDWITLDWIRGVSEIG